MKNLLKASLSGLAVLLILTFMPFSCLRIEANKASATENIKTKYNITSVRWDNPHGKDTNPSQSCLTPFLKNNPTSDKSDMENIAVMTNRIKDAKQRLEYMVNGTEFEAQIVGAASYGTALNIETPSNPHTEEQGMIKVKVNYTHPFNGQQMTVHKILRKGDYKDDRLIRIGNPEQPADSKLITHMNHNHVKQNKKLYEHYKHEINLRKISAEEKTTLLNEAFLRMTAEENSGQDADGYTQLNPPVIAAGYLLDCEILLIQKTNHTCFQEWIEDQQ